MSDQNFGENLSLLDFDELNGMFETSDMRSNYETATSQLLQEYLDILSVVYKSTPDKNLSAQVSNDSSLEKIEKTNSCYDLNASSSEKIEKPKIWSITDILRNSSDKHSNEKSSTPVERISNSESNSDQPGPSITESQIVTKNKYSKDINFDASICIDNQSPLNMSLPKIAPEIAPEIAPKIAPEIAPKIAPIIPIARYSRPKINVKSLQKVTWMLEGVEYFYEVVVYNNRRWYQCGICRVCCSDEKALYTHQHQVHVPVQNRPRDVDYCPYCGLNCFDNISLQQHINHIHPHSCFFCRIKFPSQMDLMQHILYSHPCGL